MLDIKYGANVGILFDIQCKNTFFNTNLTFIYILHKKHKSVQCSINYIILYVHIYGTRFFAFWAAFFGKA